jgi:hypothetical protein
MELRGARGSAFQIGWAFRHEDRVRRFNLAAMPELGGIRYVPVLSQPWDSKYDAYDAGAPPPARHGRCPSCRAIAGRMSAPALPPLGDAAVHLKRLSAAARRRDALAAGFDQPVVPQRGEAAVPMSAGRLLAEHGGEVLRRDVALAAVHQGAQQCPARGWAAGALGARGVVEPS